MIKLTGIYSEVESQTSMTEDITEQGLTLIPAGIPEVLLAGFKHQYMCI